MTRSESSEPVDTCFVCTELLDRQGLESVRAAIACGSCKGRARLISTNALLKDVLQSVRPYPLEGSGLAYFLNPLHIDGKRAWADFVAGGVALFEEVHSSRDYFDFLVQHVEPWCEILDTFSVFQDTDKSPYVAVVNWVQSQSPPDRKAFLDSLDSLENCWDLAMNAKWALERHGPIRTNADAWRVIDAAPSIDPFGERMKSEMLVRLHKFAARSEPRMTLPNAG
jgi:hypothetical protein